MPVPTTGDVGPDPYEPVTDLETPVLLADLDAMEANLERYAAFAEEQGVRLRSHVKTHKNPELARLQESYQGTPGVCCQTLGEAEVMAAGGIDDVYLSYQVVGESKLERAAWLAGKLDRLTTTVDDPVHVDSLSRVAGERSATVDVVVEVDAGLGRTGVPHGEPTLELARRVADAPNLTFAGLLVYEAHVKGEAASRAEYEARCTAVMDEAAETVALLEDAGVPVPEVKVGGTATSLYSGRHDVVTEINPGMYPFMDVGELEARPFDVDRSDCAATVLTTVISTPSEGRAVVDAGSKSLSMDKPEHPVPKRRDDVSYANYSEEHGWLAVDEGADLAVGDRLEFVVPHVCTTVNLHDTIVGVRDGRVEAVWDVSARGKVR